MDTIMDIAKKYDLMVIEDAAQGIMSTYKRRPLGSIGNLGCLSFHETKNIISGEGGALLVNDPELVERAETIREKGTNRSQFFRGQVDKYTWTDVGSSYLPSELIAAFLWAQMEEATQITGKRLDLWERYHAALVDLERDGEVRRPIVPGHCLHNAHMYYLLMPDLNSRSKLIEKLKSVDIHLVFHYIPLHSAPAGRRYARTHGELRVTDGVSERLVRLPLWIGLVTSQSNVLRNLHAALDSTTTRID
jgi:dTDP-4-amino-4,6-dideoxygalactose transaminase